MRMYVPVPDGVAGGLENMPLAKDNSGPASVDRPLGVGAGTECHPASWQGPSAPRSRPRLGFSGVSSVAFPTGVQGADLGSRLHFAAGHEDKHGVMGFLCVGATCLSSRGALPSLLGGPPSRLAVPGSQALAAATQVQ